MCFSAIYWPASVSDWCDSCSCTEKENMKSLNPGLPLGWGGHYRPLLHKVFTTSGYGCIAYYRQMSSWLYGKLHEQYCLIHSCTGGLASLAVGALVAIMLAAAAPIPMLRTHSYKMVQPLRRGEYVWREC